MIRTENIDDRCGNKLLKRHYHISKLLTVTNVFSRKQVRDTNEINHVHGESNDSLVCNNENALSHAISTQNWKASHGNNIH